MNRLILTSVLLLLIPGCSLLNPVPKEVIEARTQIVEKSTEDSKVLAEKVRKQLLELFQIKAEDAFSRLKAESDRRIAASQDQQGVVDAMNFYFEGKELIESQMQLEASAHASQVQGILTLGYGYQKLNEVAIAESAISNENPAELIISLFSDDLSDLINTLSEKYMPKAPEDTKVETENE